MTDAGIFGSVAPAITIMQKLSTSIIEEVTKRAVTFICAVYLNLIVLPLFGFRIPTISESFYMTGIFVTISLTIGIIIRRLFNKYID